MIFLNGGGRVLKLKTGYNPNSSSIGTNLTPLLIGGGIIAFITPFISIWVARKIKKRKALLKSENGLSEQEDIQDQDPDTDQ